MAYVLAIMTGLRREEIIGLKWSDIDWDKEILTVSRSLDYRKINNGGPRVPVFDEVKTHRSKRPIELSSVTIEALKSQRAWQAEEKLML